MTKILFSCILMVFSWSLIPQIGTTQTIVQQDLKDTIEQIDNLFAKGMEDYYGKSSMETLKQSTDLCMAALEKHPDNFEILWRCARSAGQYAQSAESLSVEGWKDINLTWGKKGSIYAAKAQEIEPERVEGYFWQVVCVGRHAIATGLVTAMKEGFYGKSKRCIEKAYEKDKSYLDYSPAISKSQFYFNLPWPMKDKKRALKYYKEFEANTKWTWEGSERRLVSAKLLLSLKNEDAKNKAKELLRAALSDPNLPEHYHTLAIKLMKKAKP